MKVIRVKTSDEHYLKALILGHDLAPYDKVNEMAAKAIAKAKGGKLQIVIMGRDTSILVEDECRGK